MKKIVICSLFIFGFYASHVLAQDVEVKIPTREEVGPDAMPVEIAPIDAPFYMPQFTRPKFPDRVISIVNYGAKRGQKFNCRTAINKAIDACHAAGGGRVLVPAGKWLTGRIELKSNVELHLADNAELHFSGELADYYPAVFCRSEGLEVYSLGAYIYAYKQDNIALTGNGTLFGPEDGPSRKNVLEKTSDKIVDQSSPVSTRIYDGIADPIYFRPYSVSPVECTNVYIEGVKIIRGAFWNVVPVYCENVVVRGVTIESVGVSNGDGVNIESSKNVLVEYCSVRTGDDSFCLKAGRDQDGLRVSRPVENVVERFNLSRGGHGGITCGSETAGSIRNIYVNNCRFEGVEYGIRFKTRRPRTGVGENLIFENIYVSAKKVLLSWEMLGQTQWVGDLAYRLPKLALTPFTPDYHDITIKSVVGISDDWILKAQGIPESPIRNVVIEDSDFSAPNGIKMTDAHDITLRNCDFRLDSDILFDLRNVQHFQTPLCRVENGVNKIVRLAEESCEDIDLSGLKITSLTVETVEGAKNSSVVFH